MHLLTQRCDKTMWVPAGHCTYIPAAMGWSQSCELSSQMHTLTSLFLDTTSTLSAGLGPMRDGLGLHAFDPYMNAQRQLLTQLQHAAHSSQSSCHAVHSVPDYKH